MWDANKPPEESGMRWTDLPATEKGNYLAFHKDAFEEDLKHAEKNILEFPRWSIISGYYCMHDLTKLFLAEKFNAKIASPELHAKAIDALEHFIRDDALKKKLLALLKEAKGIYYNSERLKEKILPALLKRGKQERGKAQYYSEDYAGKAKANSQKASYFLETIVKPYVELVRRLMG
ncbi:hypothetical protein HYV85_05715 [Candidatus Woesearchaeota archaeon]|nr:hypothetical protein [Candidatus Woesearchaeota archaeon]